MESLSLSLGTTRLDGRLSQFKDFVMVTCLKNEPSEKNTQSLQSTKPLKYLLCGHWKRYKTESMPLAEEKRYSTEKEIWHFKGRVSSPKSKFQRNSEKERDHSRPPNSAPSSFHSLYLKQIIPFLAYGERVQGWSGVRRPGNPCGSSHPLFCSLSCCGCLLSTEIALTHPAPAFSLFARNSFLTPSDFNVGKRQEN